MAHEALTSARPVAARAAAPCGRPSPAEWFAVAALLGFYVALCVSGSRVKSATNDEPAYISASDFYLFTGEFRVKRDVPPLLPFLVGAALRLHGAGLSAEPEAAPRINSEMDQFNIGWQYFAVFEQGAIRILRISRHVPILFGALLGLALFLYARRIFGRVAAWITLALFAVDPNLIAHGRTVSADLPMASLFLLCHAAYAMTPPPRAPLRLVALGVLIALCLLVKFSGPLVVVSLLAIAGVDSFRSDAPGRKRNLRDGLAVTTVAFTTLVVLSMALYRSAYGPLLYLEGMSLLYDNLVPEYFYYLNGEFKQGSWWYYYIEAMLLKTPVALLGLFALALLPVGRNRGRGAELLALLIPIFVIHLAGALDPKNFGLRRVLAACPFILLAAGRIARWFENDEGGLVPPRSLGLRGAAAIVLIAWSALSALSIHPNQLAYFNFIAGGPAGGIRFLDDSNLDWGQDLPALRRYLDENPTGTIGLAYLGSDMPWNYGIRHFEMEQRDFADPAPGVYAVAAHHLNRQRLRGLYYQTPEVDWFERFEPETILNHTMYIYRIGEEETTK